MKVRLVQDSYTKQYKIERWEAKTPIVWANGTESDYSSWTSLYPFNYGDVKGYYTDKKEAEKAFDHLVNTLKSQTIVIKEVDTGKDE